MAFLDEACARFGVSERAAGQIQLVAEEVFVNIARHGAAGTGEVTLTVRRLGSRLHVAVEDEGPPFDPTIGPDADTASALEERAVGGLGVHFLRRMMDEVRYERIGAANRLEFAKEIGSVPTP